MTLRIFATALFAATLIGSVVQPAAAWHHRHWHRYWVRAIPVPPDAAFIGRSIHFGYRGPRYDGFGPAFAFGDPVWQRGCRKGHELVMTDLGPAWASVRICP